MGEDVTANHLLIVLFDASNTRLACHFTRTISQDRLYLQFISFQIGTDRSSINVSDIIDVFIQYRNEITNVIFFSDNVNCIAEVLEVVWLSEELRYTGVLHTTEWLIVLTVLVDEIPDVLLKWNRSVDFITLLYMPFTNTTFIAQRSRTQNLTVKAKVVNYNTQRNLDSRDWPGTSCGVLRSPKDILRKSARLFLKSQKSVLEGMLLRVAVTQSLVRGNRKTTDGHANELLSLVAGSLGFSWKLVASNDSNIYGELTGKANGTGISGLLARREAALTTVPYTLNENRLQAVDYIPVRTYDEASFILYRWPRQRDNIDLIYIYIMDRQFIYMLTGTLLSLGAVGAVVHVATRSCSMQLTEPFSALDIRRLTSCPSHACLRYPGTIAAHSGRILLTSWALFIVVLGASLGAFLVTTFVIAEPPPIKSLQQLNSNKDFRVGVYGSGELTIRKLNKSTDDVLHGFWVRLVAENHTDRETFSSNIKVHMEKVIAGRYAYVGSNCVPIGKCENYILENLTDLVFFPVEDRKMYGVCFVAVTKGAFFEDDLYRLLLRANEAGLLDFLRKTYLESRVFNKAFVPVKTAIYQSNRENNSVGLVRILLVVYVALAGIGLAVGCLLVELVVYRWLARNTMYA